jgi:hypothetical protein
MDVSSLRLADRLIDDGQESNDVVSDALLDLRDPVRVEGCLANLGEGGDRNSAEGRPSLTRQNLYAKPQF